MFSGVVLVIVVYLVGLADGQAAAAAPKDKISGSVKQLKLTFNGRTLDPKSRNFRRKVASHLYGEKLETQMEVWEKMAELNDMVAKANNKPLKISASRDIDDVDAVIEEDIQLDKDDIQNMINFYKKYPEFLNLDGAITARKRSKSDERNFRTAIKKKSKKWKMPIQYKIKKGVKHTPVKEAIAVWQKETCIRFKQRKKNALIFGPNIVFKKSKNKSNVLVSSSLMRDKLLKWPFATSVRCYLIIENLVNVRQKLDENLSNKISGLVLTAKNFFSKDKGKLKTIEAVQPDYDRTLGQRFALSFYDIKAANWRYCGKKCSGGLKWSKCKHDGYKNPKKCSECKCPDGWGGKYCEDPARSRPAQLSCGPTFLTATKQKKPLASPKYGKSDYLPAHECSWRIRAPPGQRVQFQFEGAFKLRCHKRCKDYVEVRFSSTSKAGPRYCCNERPSRTFKSRKNVMLIIFRTFSGKGSTGFKANYRSITLPISSGK